jgi:ATP-dependent helicase/nuclease subunit A
MQNPPSLEGFLHWIERGGAEIKRDMERGRDEVRVMTVHGAKGLEADIVILPDTTRPASNAQKRQLLYANDGVLFSVPDAIAPQAVKGARQAANAEALNEHRRLLYVALTRAKERLYICGFENRNGVNDQSWYALMERAAEELGVPVERGGETVRVYGDAEDGVPKPAAGGGAVKVGVPDWARAAPKEERERPRVVRPSLIGDAKGLALSPLSKEGKKFKRGVLIHAALARLPEIAPAHRRDVARRFFLARDVSQGEADLLTAEILGVLDDPVFAAVFAPGSRAEVALAAELSQFGGIKVNGRVDRLAVCGDEVLVLDFKTDRAIPAQEDVPAGYKAQMALYREALKKVFAGKRIVCGLLWTAGPSLMRLNDEGLDAQLGRLADLDPGGARS